MRITHLTPEDYIRQPWKNGGGVTTELAAQRVAGKVVWRVSIAAVEQAGPFSDFSGFDRAIMLLRGNGMVLSFGGAGARSLTQPGEQRIDQPYVPYRFAGEWRTHCRLIDGPVEDFNFMFARQLARGQLRVLGLTEIVQSQSLSDGDAIVYCLQAAATITAGARAIILNPGDTLRLDECRGESLAMAASRLSAHVAIMHVGPPGEPVN
ncbi:MAG: HutD family protein [Betaproteobacteria bacterium]